MTEEESWKPHIKPIRSNWNAEKILMRGRLTDRKIDQYQKRGWYSEEFRKARKDFQVKRKARRDGNFKKNDDGRMIYSPL